MPPAPSRSHQKIEGALERWLWLHWAAPGGNQVYHQINVAPLGGWPGDYRIPDLVLLTPDRFHIDHDEYFEGAPTVVVEIRSPGDESFEKLPFYAKLGVPEVWIIDRDAKIPQIHVLSGGGYEQQTAGADGWLKSAVAGVWLRGAAEDKLGIRLADDTGTGTLLPE
jgi:Uma2 family endonuclease